MNRQEAALVIKDRLNDEIWKQENGLEVFPVNMDAFRVAIKTLRGPEPDPDTGLVPCGCGGKARLYELNDDFYLVRVECSQCYVATRATYDEERATHDWNRAMGWKGSAE